MARTECVARCVALGGCVPVLRSSRCPCSSPCILKESLEKNPRALKITPERNPLDALGGSGPFHEEGTLIGDVLHEREVDLCHLAEDAR